MKAVFKAAREILYPNGAPRVAGQRFADGSMDYSSDLAQTLMDFEQANRGHRDVLSSKILHIDAQDLVFGNGDRRLPGTIRKHLRVRAYRLCRSVVSLGRVRSDPKLANLLSAGETLGYFPAFAFDEVKYHCGNKTSTGLPLDIGITAMRVATTAIPVLHVRVTRGEIHAKRAIRLSEVSPTTLGGVRTFVLDSIRLIQNALRDVNTWPEFTGKMPTRPTLPAALLAPEPIVQAMREVARNSVNEGPQQEQATPASPLEVPALPKEDAELSSRLQRHMQDFISMYSPETQAYLAARWETFRPTVPTA